MSRGGFKITRISETETGRSSDWMDGFANRVANVDTATNAVQAARARDQQSLIDQITAIMGGDRPRFSSVQAAVEDYQERTGLKEWLKLTAEQNENQTKQAQDLGMGSLPQIFNKFPQDLQNDIATFVRNKVETHHGNVQVPAIVEDVVQTFRQRGVSPRDVNDTEFEKFISDCIVRSKSLNPGINDNTINLGKGVGLDVKNVDSGNVDIFEGLNPVKE
jgi:hypothetical protein